MFKMIASALTMFLVLAWGTAPSQAQTTGSVRCGYAVTGTATADQTYNGGISVQVGVANGTTVYYPDGSTYTPNLDVIIFFELVPSGQTVNAGTIIPVNIGADTIILDAQARSISVTGFLNATPPKFLFNVPSNLSVIETCSDVSQDPDTVLYTAAAPSSDDSQSTADMTVVTSDGNTVSGEVEVVFNIWNPNMDSGGPVLIVEPQEIEQFPAQPEVNTEVKTSDDGYYRFFRLSTGELQLNAGPNAEGKTFVTIFSPDGTQFIRSYIIEPDGSVR